MGQSKWLDIHALSDVCENMPDSFRHKQEITEMFIEFAYVIKSLQNEEGLWHQVLNCPDSYSETSASAMFLLGIARGINCGILNKEDFYETVLRAFKGIITNKVDEQGNIFDVCMGSGCSMSVDYYKKLETIENDDHGTGVILAAFSQVYKMLGA